MSPDGGALDVRAEEGGVAVRVRVVPRAARDGIAGVREGALLVRLTAPPVEGRANDALLRLLARALGIPRSAVTLVSGASARDKRVRVAGVSPERLAELAAAPARRAEGGA